MIAVGLTECKEMDENNWLLIRNSTRVENNDAIMFLVMIESTNCFFPSDKVNENDIIHNYTQYICHHVPPFFDEETNSK